MDRGFDPVAPVIHDWTYEPLVYDLLAPQGSVFKYHAQTQGGKWPSIETHLILLLQLLKR